MPSGIKESGGYPAAWAAEDEAAKLPGAERALTMDLEMITPVAIDWNKDGHLDLVVGDEDGRVALVENTGELTADRRPQFLAPVYFSRKRMS